jgi:hypothetical protein
MIRQRLRGGFEALEDRYQRLSVVWTHAERETQGPIEQPQRQRSPRVVVPLELLGLLREGPREVDGQQTLRVVPSALAHVQQLQRLLGVREVVQHPRQPLLHHERVGGQVHDAKQHLALLDQRRELVAVAHAVHVAPVAVFPGLHGDLARVPGPHDAQEAACDRCLGRSLFGDVSDR